MESFKTEKLKLGLYCRNYNIKLNGNLSPSLNTKDYFVVFSTNVWWSKYTAAIDFVNADKYNWTIINAQLYKGNSEIDFDASTFDIACSGNGVRITTENSQVSGCMVCIRIKISKK